MSPFSKIKFPILICIGIFVLGWFYWFQYRPSDIRKTCHQESIQHAQDLLKKKAKLQYELEIAGVNYYQEGAKENLYYEEDYQNLYKDCLHAKGLN